MENKLTPEKAREIEEAVNWYRGGNGWISVKDRLPERAPNKRYSQVKCLVNKRYDWKRGDNSGHYFQIQILTFNHEHECWDDESGDDHDCDIDRVTHWMPLPEPPKPENHG